VFKEDFKLGNKKIISIAGALFIIAAIAAIVLNSVFKEKPKPKPIVRPVIPEHIVQAEGPEIFFPKNARADNYDVNAFIYKFIKVLLANDYKQYRLMVTQQREPVSREKFEHAYGKVKIIRIVKIEKIGDMKPLKELGLVNCKGPAYRIDAHIILRDKRERDIKLYVFRENNKWVSSN